MGEKFLTIATGTSGVALLNLSENLDIPTPDGSGGLVSLILQIVIGVVTLIKLLKKKKE